MAPNLHSELGASIAARWMACPGSVRLSRGMPNHETIHSLNGTVAHIVGEECLTNGSEPAEAVGTTIIPEGKSGNAVEVSEEMAEAVKVYTDYCRSIMAEPGVRYWIERQFNLAPLNPPEDVPMFGTADFSGYKPQLRELEVVDLKYGSGVVVEVKGNKQTRYYALGALLELGVGLDVETVKMTIVQPRAGHVDGVIRSETIPVTELIAFAQELMAAAERTQDPEAPLVPGSHCRFCPAAPVCPAQREQAQALAQVAFEDMPLAGPPAPDTIPPEMFWDMMGKIHILDDWMKQMRQHAYHLAEQGAPTPGFKIVEKRAMRRWVDETITARHLRKEGFADDEIYTQKLKSPAQVEKLVGKKNLPADQWEKKSSGYKMVPESHPSPAVLLDPGSAFPALSAGDDE